MDYANKIVAFQLQFYLSIHKLLLSPCIKALVVAWFLFLRIWKYHFHFWYFEFSYNLWAFSSMSGPGLTRQQFKKNFFSRKGKLTQESKNYVQLCRWRFMQLLSLISLLSLLLLLLATCFKLWKLATMNPFGWHPPHVDNTDTLCLGDDHCLARKFLFLFFLSFHLCLSFNS